MHFIATKIDGDKAVVPVKAVVQFDQASQVVEIRSIQTSGTVPRRVAR